MSISSTTTSTQPVNRIQSVTRLQSISLTPLSNTNIVSTVYSPNRTVIVSNSNTQTVSSQVTTQTTLVVLQGHMEVVGK